MNLLKEKLKSLVILALVAILVLIPLGCDKQALSSLNADTNNATDSSSVESVSNNTDSKTVTNGTITVSEDGVYDSKEEVAFYIYSFNKLPSNYITKAEAKKLGWSGGSVEKYAANCCIGGSTFSNNEGLLPSKASRSYKECDIDTLGKSNRGAKRIVYSNDGLIYYTEDHYESFELLYGEE